MSDSSDPIEKKSTVDLLKEALAKKSDKQPGRQKLRPDMGNAKSVKDAERLAGKSRKVH